MDPDLRPRPPVPRRGAGPAAACWPQVPRGFAVIVVDNGSRDDTAEVAARARAPAWSPSRARVRRRRARRAGRRHRASTSRSWTATGRSTRAELLPLLERRRVRAAPTSPSAAAARSRAACGPGTPGPATPGRRGWLRRRIGLAAHDIAPMRVCRRDDLLGLERRGPAVRLPGRAAAEGDAGPAGGSPSATSPTTRAPPAPAPRCPARCGARCAPPATSGGCSHEPASRVPGGRQGAGARAGQDPARRRRSGWRRPPSSRPPRCSTRSTACAAAFGRTAATSP